MTLLHGNIGDSYYFNQMIYTTREHEKSNLMFPGG